MEKSEQIAAEARRFRLAFVRYCLMTMILMGIAAYAWDPVAAQGVFLGGLAGVIGFWLMARSLEKFALTNPEGLQFAVLRWSFARMGLYAAAFVRAFTLDREDFHGLMGAVGGFMIVRAVLMFLGFTGRDIAGSQASHPASDTSANDE